LEGRMTETFEKIHEGGAIPAIAASEAVPEDMRIGHSDSAYAWDPHLWFDVSLWTIVAAGITETLAREFPRHADAFRENFAAYRTELEELVVWIFEQVEQLSPE